MQETTEHYWTAAQHVMRLCVFTGCTGYQWACQGYRFVGTALTRIMCAASMPHDGHRLPCLPGDKGGVDCCLGGCCCSCCGAPPFQQDAASTGHWWWSWPGQQPAAATATVAVAAATSRSCLSYREVHVSSREAGLYFADAHSARAAPPLLSIHSRCVQREQAKPGHARSVL